MEVMYLTTENSRRHLDSNHSSAPWPHPKPLYFYFTYTSKKPGYQVILTLNKLDITNQLWDFITLIGKGLGPLHMKQRALLYTSINSENIIIKNNVINILLL